MRPLQEEFVGPQARLVFALLAAMVFIVLLIGCVNIANLLLARGVARRGELAVRLALGAGGGASFDSFSSNARCWRLLGGLLSIAVSRWTFNLLMSLGAVDSPWIANGGINARVLALTAVWRSWQRSAPALRRRSLRVARISLPRFMDRPLGDSGPARVSRVPWLARRWRSQ